MMAKTKMPAEWKPEKQDEYSGQGGSYVYDPETGTRRPATTPDVGAALVAAQED